MRVTVCELPLEPGAPGQAWAELCRYTARQRPELVLLPEFTFAGPVWEADDFDPDGWAGALARTDAGLARLGELGVPYVVGARPATIGGRPFNEGFLWSADEGVTSLRRKFYLPDDPGSREASWFDRGDRSFPTFRAGALSFGLNICTELWALETYGGYARDGVHAVLAPRATAAATTARWMAAGVVAAVRSGGYCLSSNGADAAGTYGGVGWIISPDGRILATTSPAAPFATMDLDLAVPAAAQRAYPCSVLGG